jgi:hypothetical protein
MNGTMHRENGPSHYVPHPEVPNYWYRRWHLNGLLHRSNGPAVVHAVGSRDGIDIQNGLWYLHRRAIPADEVEKWMSESGISVPLSHDEELELFLRFFR